MGHNLWAHQNEKSLISDIFSYCYEMAVHNFLISDFYRQQLRHGLDLELLEIVFHLLVDQRNKEDCLPWKTEILSEWQKDKILQNHAHLIITSIYNIVNLKSFISFWKCKNVHYKPASFNS